MQARIFRDGKLRYNPKRNKSLCVAKKGKIGRGKGRVPTVGGGMRKGAMGRRTVTDRVEKVRVRTPT